LGRYVAPLRHIILIPSQPVFAISPYCCVISGEATHTNFIFFCLTRPRLVPTIYRTRGEHTNHYATDAVPYFYLIVINIRSGSVSHYFPVGSHKLCFSRTGFVYGKNWKNSENSSISQLCFLSVIYLRFIITLVKGMFDLQIDKKKEKQQHIIQIFERMYVNKQCVFYCSKSKTIHGGTPVQTIMYISITKGLCTLITHISYFL
jgi:hypothetical protein